MFAAEISLPYTLFKPLVDKSDMGFAAVAAFGETFESSLMATGSRYAALVRAPCAFVLSERGKVRYASRSAALREAKAWVSLGSALPDSSLAARLRNGQKANDCEEIAADVWFQNWEGSGDVFEEARYLPAWDQTLSLLWFEEQEVFVTQADRQRHVDDGGLAELDGILPWPGKKRRR